MPAPSERRGLQSHRLSRRMLANEPVLTHSFLALDEAGEDLRVNFEESWIHQTLTAALLGPQPCFAENLVRNEGLAVPLPSRQILTRIRHICTEKLCGICKVCSVQFRHGEFYEPFFFCACPIAGPAMARFWRFDCSSPVMSKNFALHRKPNKLYYF